MAKQLTLSLFVSILQFTNAEIIDCGADVECNCKATSGQTCRLNCNSTDICKGKTLNCRPGDPCFINCESSASCSANTIINAGQSTDVTILCKGPDSCKNDINIKCGTGKCKLDCNTTTSCDDWGNINVTNSLSFECNGYCPSQEELPLYFTPSPTNMPTIPTISPTYLPSISPTNVPTLSPTYTTIIPSYNPTISPTYLPTNTPTLSPTNVPTLSPTYTTIIPSYNPTISPTYLPSISPIFTSTNDIILKLDSNNKRSIKFHDHEHYLTDPLFYMITILLFIILCSFCCLCIWIYAKEQQQKRITYTLKSKPLHKIGKNNRYSTDSNSNSNSINDKNRNIPIHIGNKYSITKLSMDNSSELYTRNDGPLPTYLKLNTTDLNTHLNIIQSKSNPIKQQSILLPSQIKKKYNRRHALSDGSTTQPLPMPPPRKSAPLSPHGIISNVSSPANTPIPDTPSNIYNCNIISPNYDLKYDDDDIYNDLKIKQPGHGQYASLPTIPSLPAITPEHSISYTEQNLSINPNNYNPSLNHNNSANSIRISMVSQMESMDNILDINPKNIEPEITVFTENEMSETIEYESHRKQTFESYDMGGQLSPFNIGNKFDMPFDISVIGKASTIRLEDIREESRKSVVSSFSETSVPNDDESSVEKNLVEKNLNNMMDDCSVSDASDQSIKL